MNRAKKTITYTYRGSDTRQMTQERCNRDSARSFDSPMVPDLRPHLATHADLRQSDEVWAIRSLTAKGDEGEPLYWSNEWGWGSGDTCQLFTAQEHVECNLPIGGQWEKW